MTSSEPRNEGTLKVEEGTSSALVCSRVFEDKGSVRPVVVDDVER